MTPSELKYNLEAADPDSHFFNRKTMRFFGDTMSNYGCRSTIIDGKPAYEIYRKRAVKQGLRSSAYFCAETFNQIYQKN